MTADRVVATNYRVHASGLREMAKQMSVAQARQETLALADEWERLAARVEMALPAKPLVTA
jgi:hypothetical protein